MIERTGWFADLDPESIGYQWQPCLQTSECCCHSLDVWFRTEDECKDYIRRFILGQGMIYD